MQCSSMYANRREIFSHVVGQQDTMIYSISIFKGRELVHHEPVHYKTASLDTDSKRLLVGMLSAVCGIVSMLSGNDSTPRFEMLTTPEYRIDYYETPTGYKFVLMSELGHDITRGEVRTEFERLYKLLFVPLVIRNPFYKPSMLSGDLRDSRCEVFISELRNHFQIFSYSAAVADSSPKRIDAPQLTL